MLNRLSAKHIQLFTQQLSTMLMAKMPLLSAINILIKDQTNDEFKQMLKRISKSLSDGNPFSEALSKYPKHFDKFYLQMVKIGEKTGQIDTMLERVNQYLVSKEELKNKMVQALSYPSIILFVTTAAILFLLIFVVPEFENIFKDYNAELPQITQFILAISTALSKYGLYIFFALLVIIIFLYRFSVSKAGYKVFSQLYLRIPFFGELIKQIFISRICLFLAVLLESKVTLLEALDITKSSVHNYYYEKEMKRMISFTSRGDRLSDSITRSKLFPEMVIQMLTVGEETAHIHHMLQSVSDYYQKEIDRFTARVSSMIEPLMIIVLGLIVGTIVISIYLPMFDLGTIVK